MTDREFLISCLPSIERAVKLMPNDQAAAELLKTVKQMDTEEKQKKVMCRCGHRKSEHLDDSCPMESAVRGGKCDCLTFKERRIQ